LRKLKRCYGSGELLLVSDDEFFKCAEHVNGLSETNNVSRGSALEFLNVHRKVRCYFAMYVFVHRDTEKYSGIPHNEIFGYRILAQGIALPRP
jgi:hypothetical protein